MSELERIAAFTRSLDRAWSERAIPFAHGHAYFHSRVPRIWDLNVVSVEDPAAQAEALDAEAERLHAAGGHGHRKLWVDDAALGARLEPGLRTLGWGATPLVVLVQRGTPEGAGGGHEVVELDVAGIQEARRRELSIEPAWTRSEDDLRQVLEAKAIKAEAGARFFAALADGEPAALCDVYTGDGVGQVEDVLTFPALRGRGLAGALVAGAAAAAREGGAELVFLTAEESNDTALRLYRRLGFEPAGQVYSFSRRGGSRRVA